MGTEFLKPGARELIRKILIVEEDWCNHAYPDPLTQGEPWTVGVGCTGPGINKNTYWTNDEVELNLQKKMDEAITDVQNRFSWVQLLTDARQAVIICMCYQMGINRLAKFIDTLGYVRRGYYEQAGNAMEQSKWARQTPLRAARMVELMVKGVLTDGLRSYYSRHRPGE